MESVPGRSPFGGTQSWSSLVFEEFEPPSAWTEDSTCHYLLVDLPGFKRQELKLQVENRTHILVSGERQVRENKYKRFEKSYELPKDADIEKITGKLDGEILYISVPKKVEEHKEIKNGSNLEPASSSNEDDNDKKSETDESDDEQQHTEIKHDIVPAPAQAPLSDENEYGKNSSAYENDYKDGENDLDRKKHSSGFDDNWGQDAELFLRLAMEKLRKNKGVVVTAIFAFSLGVLVTQKFQSNGH
ncbi:hypothetical protein R6Q57_020952 [Mikania cordata]